MGRLANAHSRLDSIVDLITDSLILFSSIGLFALTLNARYTHAAGRVRDIYDDLQKVMRQPSWQKNSMRWCVDAIYLNVMIKS